MMARKNRFFNWREDLHEYLGTNTSMADRANAVPAKAKTDTKAQKKIDTAKVNNKVVINPPMKEAFEEIGGTILEVVEIEEELSVERRQKAAAIGAKSPSYKTRFAAMKLASGDNKPVRGKGNKAAKRAAALNTEDTDLDQMKKDAESNRENFKKGSVKRDKYHKGAATFAAAKVADDVKKAARTGPQQDRSGRVRGHRIDKPAAPRTVTGAVRKEEYVDEEGKLGHLQQKRAMVDMKIAKERVKMAKKAKKSGEDVVAEKMDMKKADMGDVVKDFYKSDAPQFKGKSKTKRREMAIAAKLQADEDEN